MELTAPVATVIAAGIAAGGALVGVLVAQWNTNRLANKEGETRRRENLAKKRADAYRSLYSWAVEVRRIFYDLQQNPDKDLYQLGPGAEVGPAKLPRLPEKAVLDFNMYGPPELLRHLFRDVVAQTTIPSSVFVSTNKMKIGDRDEFFGFLRLSDNQEALDKFKRDLTEFAKTLSAEIQQGTS